MQAPCSCSIDFTYYGKSALSDLQWPVMDHAKTFSRFPATPIRCLIGFMLLLSLLIQGCATRSYQFESTDSFPIQERAITESQGDITVSTSVPSEEETTSIFGVPLYDRGIQPVWLEIVNNSEQPIRFAPSSVDREYYSPLEVSYVHRKGFSKEARAAMDKRFHQAAMPRRIPAGETRSGYVFTHARPGTKSYNVDVYSMAQDYTFAFFVAVPGFVPDHNEVNFADLYTEAERQDFSETEFRHYLTEKPLITTSEDGQDGLPVNILMVGDGLDILKSLLRAGWYEQPSTRHIADPETAHYMFGRLPDAVFRIQRSNQRERNELYTWLSPIQMDGKPVWVARVAHFIGQKTQIEEVLFGTRIDPDINEGRSYFVQNMWYSQNLKRLAWLRVNEAVTIEKPGTSFEGIEYFSDGYVSIVWLSGEPVSLIETVRELWDPPPFQR